MCTDQPVRRSARLAGRPPASDPSSATIVKQQTPPPPERPIVPSGSPLSPSPSGSAIEYHSRPDIDPLSRLGEMRLAVAPPDTIVAGVALTTPVLVTFEISSADKEKDEDDESSVDFSGCWAFLSLVAEDRKEMLAPPRKDLLEGSITDSIHGIDRVQDGSIRILGYAAFRDLKILEAGKYCFGVSVVDMNNTMSSTEVKISKVVHSDIFHVVDETNVQVTAPSEALARLKEIGIDIE